MRCWTRGSCRSQQCPRRDSRLGCPARAKPGGTRTKVESKKKVPTLFSLRCIQGQGGILTFARPTAAKSLTHRGHEGTRRKSQQARDFLREPSCPSWLKFWVLTTVNSRKRLSPHNPAAYDVAFSPLADPKP